MKQYFVLLLSFFIFSGNLFSQAYLEQENCIVLKASYDGQIKPKSSKGKFAFILEKEIATNLWKKIKTLESWKPDAQFIGELGSTYRVTIIPKQIYIPQKTSSNHRLSNEENGKQNNANTFLSNSVSLKSNDDCTTQENIDFKSKTRKSKNEILLYPNPAQDKLWIKWRASLALKTISIYTFTGTVLMEINCTANSFTEINLSNLPSGIYLVKGSNGKGLIISERISIIR